MLGGVETTLLTATLQVLQCIALDRRYCCTSRTTALVRGSVDSFSRSTVTVRSLKCDNFAAILCAYLGRVLHKTAVVWLAVRLLNVTESSVLKMLLAVELKGLGVRKLSCSSSTL